MTNVKPATDEEIAFCVASDGVWTTFERMLAARVDADREEIALLRGETGSMDLLVTKLREEIAALKAEVERPRCNDLLCRCCARRAR